MRHDPDIVTAVIRAAETCLAAPVVAAWSLSRIARVAGCGRATVYRHFGSLDGIFDRVVTSLGAALTEAHARPIRTEGAARRGIEEGHRLWRGRPALLTIALSSAGALGEAARIAARSRSLEVLQLGFASALLDRLGVAPPVEPDAVTRPIVAGWLRPGHSPSARGAPAASHATRPPGDGTRARLLIAASSTLADRPARLPSLARLARVAGVGMVTPYRTFRHREQLYVDVARELAEALAELTLDATPTPRGIVESVTLLAHIFGAHAGIGPSLVGPATMPRVVEVVREALARLLVELERLVADARRAFIEVHVGPGRVTPLVVALVGVALTAAASTRSAPTRAARARRWCVRALAGG